MANEEVPGVAVREYPRNAVGPGGPPKALDATIPLPVALALPLPTALRLAYVGPEEALHRKGVRRAAKIVHTLLGRRLAALFSGANVFTCIGESPADPVEPIPRGSPLPLPRRVDSMTRCI